MEHFEEASDEAIYDAVAPFYLELLHVNIAQADEQVRNEFVAAFATAARTISDDLLVALLAEVDWRSRMVAGWIVAVAERHEHLPAIRAGLVAANFVYPQGLLIALATLADDAGARALSEFLERWLTAEADHCHDQPWVLAALEEVDRCLGTDHTVAFVAPGGPWDTWAGESAGRYREAGRDWLTEAARLVDDCRSST